MNVLLVSQCDKNALKESRRILDQFAERRGDRTWQTPITRQGLDTLRRMLRKTARKNTAVACHWIRGRDHSELVWIVGDARRFNAQGAVPTNTTRRDVLRRGDENDWHTGEDIALLARLAALMHDLGKACMSFQAKLKPGAPLERNLYRHEWISLRLFEAFVGDDDDATWLARLADPETEDDNAWLARLNKDGVNARDATPFRHLPPLAAAIGWLIVTHHRLPVMPAERRDDGSAGWLGAKVPGFQARQLLGLPGIITAAWNETCESQNSERVAPYWHFPEGLPVTTPKWRARAAQLAQSLNQRQSQDWLDNPYVMHLARLTLMLADHYYSSLSDPLQRVRGLADYPLLANTLRGTGEPNQPLDEHLLGVEKHSGAVSRSLPGMERYLPRLARHQGFRKRSADARFRWQDRAFDLAVGLRERSRSQGFFGVNMASTGCGKTLANARILYALADPDIGARFSIALGLRTLTLQTGQAYRDRLNLGDDDLAIRVGGGASRALFEYHQDLAEQSGSASVQSLLPEDSYVRFDGNLDNHPLLSRVAHDPAVKALIAAPILVCTVDHLTPATESQRGGRQIAPMLRLMSGDLVLDEPDDFGVDDLPALTRLVHWAGLLGARVLLSSATLPPSLIQGLYDAYRDGRNHYQRNRGETGAALNICCAWFDEHGQAHQDCPDSEAFIAAHQRFAEQRAARLSKAPVRRRAQLAPLVVAGRQRHEIAQEFAAQVLAHAQGMHRHHHTVDPESGKRVSFGLVRLANIEPLMDVALALYQCVADTGQHIHLCVYHSQYPLLIRSAIEARLDQALNRRDPLAVFRLPDIRQRLEAHAEPDQLFIVLGSPVTEVGRDHDYDWAVVEPSSMRSMIQLAGRVRRHRDGNCAQANLVLLDTNIRHLTQPEAPAFQRPGFEGRGDWLLRSHRLEHLLTDEERSVIDARPRILARPDLRPRDSLIDLEHARLQHCMVAPPVAVTAEPDGAALSRRERIKQRQVASPPPLGAYTWYGLPRASLTAVLPQQQPFRNDTTKRVDLVLMPDDSGESYGLQKIRKERGRRAPLYVDVEASLHHRIPDQALASPTMSPWGEMDYLETLAALADDLGQELESCARRFGTVTLPESDQGWRFHPALGFVRQR
jgi:CRISPR-associated endonuclease/helicase Cas3